MRPSDAVRRLGTWGRFAAELARTVPEHLRATPESTGSLGRRLGEQARLLVSSGISASDYYAYGLDRRELSWTRKREFVGHVDRWRWLNVPNPPAYRFLTEDKLIFKRFMRGSGVAVPALRGVFGPGGRAETGEPLATPADLAAWLVGRDIRDVALKPTTGTRGTGILILGERTEGEPPRWRAVPEGVLGVPDIVAHMGLRPDFRHYLIEDRVRPHPALACFSPDLAVTVRILTALDDGVEIIAGALRIPTGRTPADNFSQGNLAAPIDLETGRIGTAAYKKERGLGRIRAHPVTGATIEGREVPDWARTLDVVRTAAAATAVNQLLAWDVALAPEGPVVLEANDIWDADVLQIAPDQGLLGTRLGAYLKRHDLIRRVGLGW